MFYFDAGHETKPGPGCYYSPDQYIIQAASESWFLHIPGYSDSAHRVYGKWANGCISYAMNPNSSGLQAWFINYLRNNAANYDYLFSDEDSLDVSDTGWFASKGGCDPWPHICTSFQEIVDDPGMITARDHFISAMRYSNGSPMYAFYQQAHLKDLSYDLAAMAGTANFVGDTCEGCVAGLSGPPVNPARFSQVLSAMATINTVPNGSFVLISVGQYPAGSAAQLLQRSVTTGIAWLGYSQGHTIVWPDLENSSSGLSVWPEDLIYPSSPLQSMATGPGDLQVSSGVWRREFSICYQKGQYFGRCAAIVNSTGNNVTVQSSWLARSYAHVISLSGGDVLSGGSASVNSVSFTPNVTVVPAGAALLLAQ